MNRVVPSWDSTIGQRVFGRRSSITDGNLNRFLGLELMMKKYWTALILTAMAIVPLGAEQAQASIVIDFDALVSTPFTTIPYNGSTEDGFAITLGANSAAISASNLFPPSPMSGVYLLGDPAPSPAQGIINVVSTTPGGVFTFESLGVYNFTASPVAPPTQGFLVVGYLNNSSVGTEAFNLAHTTGLTHSATPAFLSGVTVDRLEIYFPVVFTDGNTINSSIDNIVLGEVSPGSPVPEPGTVWLFGSLLLGLAGLGSRKRDGRPAK